LLSAVTVILVLVESAADEFWKTLTVLPFPSAVIVHWTLVAERRGKSLRTAAGGRCAKKRCG